MEWLFSSNAGRIQLSETAGFKRLVVVCLHRGQSYGSLKDIQDELSEKVLELAPSDLESNVKVNQSVFSYFFVMLIVQSQ